MAAEPELEALAASAIFGTIIELPEADLRQAMLECVTLGNGTAFDILEQICFYRAKWDPKRAVTMAELTVQMIELHRDLLKNGANDWKALAWSFLGWVQALTGDFGAADRSLTFAWEEAPGGRLAPWVEVEVRRLEGALRMRQARAAEATRALDRAVELGRVLGPDDPNLVHSVVERLELASFLGDTKTTRALCRELEKLGRGEAAGTERVADWRSLVSYHRGKASAADGDDDRARKYFLEAAERLPPEASEDIPPKPELVKVHNLAALAGMVLHELARLDGRGDRLDLYESRLLDALDRYRVARTPVLAAGAQAELAVLCALQDRPVEARRWATDAALFFDQLPGHRRTWSVSRRLHGLANGAAELPKDDLSFALAAMCAELDALRWEITGAQATPAAEATRVVG